MQKHCFDFFANCRTIVKTAISLNRKWFQSNDVIFALKWVWWKYVNTLVILNALIYFYTLWQFLYKIKKVFLITLLYFQWRHVFIDCNIARTEFGAMTGGSGLRENRERQWRDWKTGRCPPVVAPRHPPNLSSLFFVMAGVFTKDNWCPRRDSAISDYS